MESSGLPLVHDMFTNGETPHGCGHVPRTHHKGIRTTGADFVTNDQHKDNIDIVVETLVDKINFEEKDGQLQATSVTLVDKDGAKRDVKAKKEIIVSSGKNPFTIGEMKMLTLKRCILLTGCITALRHWSHSRSRKNGYQNPGGFSRSWKKLTRPSCWCHPCSPHHARLTDYRLSSLFMRSRKTALPMTILCTHFSKKRRVLLIRSLDTMAMPRWLRICFTKRKRQEFCQLSPLEHSPLRDSMTDSKMTLFGKRRKRIQNGIPWDLHRSNRILNSLPRR